MEWTIMILLLLLVIIFIWNISSKSTYGRSFSYFYAVIISITLNGVLITYNSKYDPTALDVYQGKTTLEITYRDSIPVDSIVVFKEEFKLVE